MYSKKKTISPVVAIALLLVVSVVAVVGYQQWYQGYQSTLFIDTEQKSSNSGGRISVEYITSDGIMYVYNRGNENVTLSSIDVGGNDCNINEDIEPGVTNISIASCLNQTGTNEILIVTDEGIVQEKLFVEKIETGGIVVSLSTSLSCDTDLDGDGYINSSCAFYPMVDLSYEGDLDGSDYNNTITANISCVWASDKSSCLNNFVENGCGAGTVLDLGSGLCWQKNMNAAGPLTWANGVTYCGGLSLGGHNDWDLPTYNELYTIVDLSRNNPAIVGGNNNKFDDVQAAYWTKTSSNVIIGEAFYILLLDGDGPIIAKTNTLWITCVRRS